jgi:hypothetical protein
MLGIPIAGGVGVVVLFAVSFIFPAARGQRWFGLAIWVVGLAILAHPLWAVIHFVLRLVVRMDRRHWRAVERRDAAGEVAQETELRR